MKNKIFSVLIVLFVQLQAISQKRELDWQKFLKSVEQTKIAEPVPAGQFTIFQISNINKFLYRVEIEGKVFELQTPIPTELQSLFRLSSTELEKTVTNKKADKAAEQVSNAIPPMAEVAEGAKKKIGELQTKIKATPYLTSQEKLKTEKVDQTQLATAADEIVIQCKHYLELIKNVSHDIFNLKTTRNKLVSIAQMDLSQTDIQSKVLAVSWPLPDIQTNFLDLKEAYGEIELLYSELEAKAVVAKSDPEIIAAIKSSLDKVESADDLIDQETLLGLLNDVDYLYNELKNPNNFTVVAPPVQMDGDMVTYSVSITPTATRSLGAYNNPRNFKFNIPTKGGLKVDFSVGPTISFGKHAKDEKFFLEETFKTDTVVLRQRPNNNTIVPSIAAMMHFYSRGSHVGGMMGVGAGFSGSEQLNANIFLGLSYIMGKRQKLMISGGFSYLRIDRLKDSEFKPGTEYKANTVDISNVTEKVFKRSLFLSLSYNLTNKVEIN